MHFYCSSLLSPRPHSHPRFWSRWQSEVCYCFSEPSVGRGTLPSYPCLNFPFLWVSLCNWNQKVSQISWSWAHRHPLQAEAPFHLRRLESDPWAYLAHCPFLSESTGWSMRASSAEIGEQWFRDCVKPMSYGSLSGCCLPRAGCSAELTFKGSLDAVLGSLRLCRFPRSPRRKRRLGPPRPSSRNCATTPWTPSGLSGPTVW